MTQSLVTKIIQAANQISKVSRRGSANYIMVSTESMDYLDEVNRIITVEKRDEKIDEILGLTQS